MTILFPLKNAIFLIFEFAKIFTNPQDKKHI